MEVRPGYKQTEVGVIPVEWEELLLDSVATRGSGHTPNKKHPEYWNGDIKWVSLMDSGVLDNLYIEETTAKITSEGIKNSSAVLHPAGTVILSRDAGVGKSAIMNDRMAVSQHFMAWQCGPRLNNHYFYYWLQLKKSEFERIAIGSTIKTIGLSYFRNLKIPCPPIAEQLDIAALLINADALIESLDQLLAKKRNIKQGAMQELLTGKKRLPGFSGKWRNKELGALLSICHGKSQREVEVADGPYPILATGGLIGSARRYLYDKPSVLIGRKGTIDQPQYMDTPFWTVDTLFYSVVHEPNNAKFIYYRFCLIDWKQHNEASGVPSLNARTVEKIEINIPGQDEQSAIAAILSDMDTEIAALEEKVAKARQIKQGMMQELLTGRIRLG